MVAVKAHEADRLFRAKSQPTQNACLIYGPDRGLVAERAKAFAKASGVSLEDPFSHIKLSGGELGGHNAARIVDETSTVSMFGGNRLVHITDGTNDTGLISALKTALEDLSDTTFLLVEAGDLKKSAALRSLFEKSKTALAVPCYADDTKSLQVLINEVLEDAGKTISVEARELLISNLGGDRGSTRQELSKLILYVRGEDRIETAHVSEIIGDNSDVVVDEVIDGLLIGDLAKCETALAKLETSGSSSAILMAGLTRQLQQLDILRATMTERRTTTRAVVEATRPPIFFRRKPIVTKALELWSSEMIRNALTKLEETTLSSRTSSALTNAHIRMMVLSLGHRAYATGRRIR